MSLMSDITQHFLSLEPRVFNSIDNNAAKDNGFCSHNCQFFGSEGQKMMDWGINFGSPNNVCMCTNGESERNFLKLLTAKKMKLGLFNNCP